jgi:iron(III) transport system permease protein
MSWPLVENSLLVSAAATLLAGLFGLAAALWAAGLTGRSRNCALFLAAAPLLWPPFLVLNCWLNLLGESGLWRSWIPFSILSPGGTVWVLALLKWPVFFFLLNGAWGRVDPDLLAADLRLSGWPLFRRLLWPQARGAAGFAAVITFVLCLNELSVPSLLQVKVFPTEIWINFNTTFNYGGALRASWPLVVFPLLLLRAFRSPEMALSWRGLRPPDPLLRAQLGLGWPLAAAFSILVLALSLGVPAVQLAGESKTWRELGPAWAAGLDAGGHSLLYSSGAALACLALGAALSSFRAGVLLWIPFFLPGVLLGIALVFLLNRPGLRLLAQSGWVVVFAYALRYGALPWAAVRAWSKSVPANLSDDARLMGAGAWTRFRHLFWPAHGGRLLGLAYVIYLLALWDVETLLMIVPPGGETLSLRVFNLLHYGHNGQVNALCLILLLLGAAPLLAAALLRRVVASIPARPG